MKLQLHQLIVPVVGATLLFSVACDRKAEAKASDSPAVEAPSSPAVAEPRAASKGEEATPETKIILSSYESIRSALSQDEVAGLDENATAIGKASRKLAASGKSDWANVAKAADQLKSTPKKEMDQLRKGFGELSQSLITILAKNDALASGLHVFECPMAQGYKKWVQPASEISNPYMGTKMPKCGSKSEL